jgi:hypothetical protein
MKKFMRNNLRNSQKTSPDYQMLKWVTELSGGGGG